LQLKETFHTGYRPFRNAWCLEELGLPYEHIKALPKSKVPVHTGDAFTLLFYLYPLIYKQTHTHTHEGGDREPPLRQR
jgi:hypothetical protein